MRTTFPFKKEHSPLFKIIYRPMAWVYFWIRRQKTWLPIYGIVDTGADYTILPYEYASKLKVSLKNDCVLIKTRGVGGTQKVCLLKEEMIVSLSSWQKKIPVGFFSDDELPPLFGRQAFLEKFKLTFHRHKTTFEE